MNHSFHIYGYDITLEDSQGDIISKLVKDFSYFINNQTKKILSNKTSIKIIYNDKFKYSNKSKLTKIKLESRINFQYPNSITNSVSKNFSEAIFTHNNFEGCYEQVYLFILSITGKAFDLKGIHRIHALGIEKENESIILMANSGTGKTTQGLEVLKDSSIKLISDDTPLIDPNLNIYPFPVRIGHNNQNTLIPFLRDGKNLYSINRLLYGKKFLLDLNDSKICISTNIISKNITLLELERNNSSPRIAKSLNRLYTFKKLFFHQVIGFGLPMIKEYFLEDSIYNLIKIAISRVKLSIKLSQRIKCHQLNLSESFENNSKLILNVNTNF